MFSFKRLMLSISVLAVFFVIVSVAELPAQTNPDSGMVAFWPFTGNPSDSSGFHRNAVIFGATLCPDRFGTPDRAYYFNGTNAYMTVPDDTVWPFGKRSFTIALWIRFDVVRITYPIGQSEGTSNQRKWLFWYSASNEFVFHHNGTAIGSRFPIYQYRWFPVASRWYHISCTRLDSLYSLYVNGVFYAAGTEGDTLPNVSTVLEIGRVQGQGYLQGALDNIRFYNRALSSADIRELYRRESLPPSSVDLVDRLMPSGFALFQNYPNPFNPETKIKFQIPTSSDVVLQVFDVLGREVKTLVNERLQPGSYETTFDGKDLSSGVYLYRLQAGSAWTGSARRFVETKKLLLLR
jgi:hypothetical protein